MVGGTDIVSPTTTIPRVREEPAGPLLERFLGLEINSLRDSVAVPS